MDRSMRLHETPRPATPPPRIMGPAHAGVALALLCLGNAFNLADRMLLGVLQEPIRDEFRLNDFELGLLGGSSFAILYSLLSIPIARLADRSNRITIAACALGLWSAMTAVCGLAGSYAQLLIARAGVSVGEAGGVAPSLSYLSDVFSLRRRATAMAVFAIGGPAGALIATMAGGRIAQDYGWRVAFLTFGLAGLTLAILIRLLLREVRAPVSGSAQVRFADAVRLLARKRSYLHVCAAGAFASFCLTFIMQYMVSFLMRVHGLPIAQAALVVGVAGGLFGMVGAFSGGFLADMVARRSPGARTLVITGGFTIGGLAYACAWWSPLCVAIPLLFLGALTTNSYPGISYAVSSAIAPPGLRATSIALFTIAGNLLGYALGPPILGAISDAAAHWEIVRAGGDPARCLVDATTALCLHGKGAGLRWALTCGSLLIIVGAVHHWRASKTLAQDLEAEPDQALIEIPPSTASTTPLT